MKEKKYKEVTREEYYEFIKKWPNKLRFNWKGRCDPPFASFNDLTDGKKWPDSIVAKAYRDWMGPNREIDNSIPGKYWKYYILII